jgi:hypothetical protein
MSIRRLAAVSAAVLLGLVAAARADLAAWDQEKVTGIAKQLDAASRELYDAFYKQPVPTVGSAQTRAYQRLKHDIRLIRTQARQLARDLERGEGMESTQPGFEELMSRVRSARDEAPKIFTTKDVADKAAAAREQLNALGPYYDPDYEALGPATR